MADLFFRRKRTSQPQYPVKVNQSNPLTKGLQDVAVLGNTLRWNAARNTFLSSNGTVNSDPRGPIITTDATAYSVPGGYSAPPITVIIGFARTGAPTSGNHALWISKDDITGNGGLYFRYEDAGTLAVLKSQTAGVGSGSYTVKPGGSLLAVTVDSGNFALYGDGGLVASGSHAQTFTSTTPVIGSESSEAAEDHPNGIFYFHAVWDRVLSAGEIKRISDNPWLIFEDRKQPAYMASGGPTSITASDTLTPSFTEAQTSLVSSSVTETLLPSLTEAAALFKNPEFVTVTDTLTVSVTEALALFAESLLTDTLTPSLTDSSTLDTGGAPVTVDVTETLTPGFTEASETLAALLASDTLTPTLTEAQESLVYAAVTEALTLTLGEVQGSLLASAITDVFSVSVSDAVTLLVAVTASETLTVSITDSSGLVMADVIAKTVSETLAPYFTELGTLELLDAWQHATAVVGVWTTADSTTGSWVEDTPL